MRINLKHKPYENLLSKKLNLLIIKRFMHKYVKSQHSSNINNVRKYATYFNGNIQKPDIKNTACTKKYQQVQNTVYWKHPLVFGKLCPNCHNPKCNNYRHSFCKYHPKTNFKFVYQKTKYYLFGSTTHGNPTFAGIERKQKIINPLSNFIDMDGNKQKNGTTYNFVLFKKPIDVTGLDIHINPNRTKYVNNPIIRKRLNAYIASSQPKTNLNKYKFTKTYNPQRRLKIIKTTYNYNKVKQKLMLSKTNNTILNNDTQIID